LTRRRSTYRSVASLQRDNRACRACAEAGYRIESRPVLEGHSGQEAFILGQAPDNDLAAIAQCYFRYRLAALIDHNAGSY